MIVLVAVVGAAVVPVQNTRNRTVTYSLFWIPFPILEFFDKAEAAGRNIPAVIGPQVDLTGDGAAPESVQTVAFEARQLKNLFLKLYDN